MKVYILYEHYVTERPRLYGVYLSQSKAVEVMRLLEQTCQNSRQMWFIEEYEVKE